MPFQLEICCFNLESVRIASGAGTQRIELCADPHDGGTTPSLGMIKTAKGISNTQLYPIIRPRGGDFLYSEEEFESMLNDAALCKQLDCEGIVTGILRQDGSIDKRRMSKLVDLAYPMGVTFHRAFDWSKDPFEALEDIIEIGCERILTSGQMPMAIDGAPLIRDLILQAGHRIILMPGSGVRAHNIIALAEQTKAEEFHTSARILARGHMDYLKPSMGEEYQSVLTDNKEIQAILKLLEGHFGNSTDHGNPQGLESNLPAVKE
jgi:copper homeostasis protein